MTPERSVLKLTGTTTPEDFAKTIRVTFSLIGRVPSIKNLSEAGYCIQLDADRLIGNGSLSRGLAIEVMVNEVIAYAKRNAAPEALKLLDAIAVGKESLAVTKYAQRVKANGGLKM